MKIKFKYSRFQIAIEIIALLILVGMFVYPMVMWGSMPDKLPMHYNGAGEINRWGSKYEIIILPFISVFLYLLLTIVVFFPSSWNIPVTVTDRNRDKVYRCLRSMVVLMKAEVMAAFFYITYNTIQVKPLSSDFLQIELTAIFGTIIFFIIRLIRVSKK
jgi:uncharacterized membrane protein